MCDEDREIVFVRRPLQRLNVEIASRINLTAIYNRLHTYGS